MKLGRRQFLSLAAGAATLAALPRQAGAQAWPSRPITMVVPVPAGGALDTNARLVASGMSPALGQPVVIENVTGASGSIGTGKVARSSPDGYTLVYGANVTHVLNAAVYNLNYDVVADFEPIALIGSTPWLIVGKKDLPADDLKGFIAWLKANPDKGTEGTAGLGSGQHISGVYFQKVTGTQFRFVPYKAGSADIIRDMVAGHIDFTFDQAITSLNHIKGGNVKAYAVTSDKRLEAAPDIPTVDEAGAPGVYISTWYGLWVPKGTPPDAIRKLSDAAMKAMADPAVRAKLAGLGQQIPTPEQQTAAALAAYQKAEVDKWHPLIKEAGIKAE
jgi:tripartite-type tricarboxylate transporter receptor subunit TctC